MRPRGGPPRMSEGVAASHCHLPRKTLTAPPSVPSPLKVHVDGNTWSVQVDPPSIPTAVSQSWRSPTGAFHFPARNESALRPEAPTFEPPSSLSAGAWCFTPPIINPLTSQQCCPRYWRATSGRRMPGSGRQR